MAVAALITWIITAVLGITMLGLWLSRGGMSGPTSGATAPSRLPRSLIFGHPLLAVIGLILWIIYLATDRHGLTWVVFGLLVVVGILGDLLFMRWRRSVGVPTPEARFPVAVVYGHGLFAGATVILVFLTALGVGS